MNIADRTRRRVAAAIALVVAPVLCVPVAQALAISSSETGEDKYQVLIESDATIEADEARTALLLTGYAICGYEIPDVGVFEAKGDASLFRYTLQITCLPPEEPEESVPEMLSAVQKQAIEEEVRLLTEEHFHLVDAGRFEVALRDLDGNSFRKDEWQASREAFRAQAGRMQEFRITDLEIGQIPGDDPEPQIYIGVSFRNTYEKVQLECGFFTWTPAPNGEYRVISADLNYITRDRFASLTELERTVVDIRMGCRRN